MISASGHSAGHGTHSGHSRRIVHVTRRFWPMTGGVERYVLDLATAQAERGHAVRVVTLDRDTVGELPGRFAPRDRVAGVDVRRIPGTGGRRMAITTRPDRLVRLATAGDFLHVHDLRFMFGTLLGLAALRRVPVLLHTHGLIFHTTSARAAKEFAFRAYYGPLAAAAGSLLLASSEADRLAVIRRAPYLAARIRTLLNALDLTELLAARRQPEPNLILVHGRVVKSKGLDDLLVALARLPAGTWRLLIAGAADPDELERLAAVAQALGIDSSVAFHGRFGSGEVTHLLARARLAVFPSRAEGFGLALLEAMAVGVSVLARSIPPHREVLGEGFDGRLVDFSDPDAAAEAIRRELEADPATTNAASERLRARARRFDIPRLLNEIEDIYRVEGSAAAQG